MTVYFLDDWIGDDGNDGLTPETALKTPAALFRLIDERTGDKRKNVILVIGSNLDAKKIASAEVKITSPVENDD